jgi:hypothetical protein
VTRLLIALSRNGDGAPGTLYDAALAAKRIDQQVQAGGAIDDNWQVDATVPLTP